MKTILVIVLAVLLGAVAWRVGNRLSADALGMGLGVLFGVLAGIPTALFVLASGRRRDGDDANEHHARRGKSGQTMNPYGGYPQPPIIVLAGNGLPAQLPQQYGANGYGSAGPYAALPAPDDVVEARQFRVVGEKEEWVDEF